jgi:hypothetical protein
MPHTVSRLLFKIAFFPTKFWSMSAYIGSKRQFVFTAFHLHSLFPNPKTFMMSRDFTLNRNIRSTESLLWAVLAR